MPTSFWIIFTVSNPIDFPMLQGNQQLTIPGFNYMFTLLMF